MKKLKKLTYTLFNFYRTLSKMITPMLLQSAMMLPLMGATSSPINEGLSNLVYKPADNIGWIIALAVAFVALAGLAIYLVKRWYDDKRTSPSTST